MRLLNPQEHVINNSTMVRDNYFNILIRLEYARLGEFDAKSIADGDKY